MDISSFPPTWDCCQVWYRKKFIWVAVSMDWMLGLCISPEAAGPYNAARGKCSFNPKAWQYRIAICFSMHSISATVYGVAINRYNMLGSSIIFIAFHISPLGRWQWKSFPLKIAIFCKYVMICEDAEPFKVSVTRSVRRNVYGSRWSSVIHLPVALSWYGTVFVCWSNVVIKTFRSDHTFVLLPPWWSRACWGFSISGFSCIPDKLIISVFFPRIKLQSLDWFFLWLGW